MHVKLFRQCLVKLNKCISTSLVKTYFNFKKNWFRIEDVYIYLKLVSGVNYFMFSYL